jgi:hypothetical protein
MAISFMMMQMNSAGVAYIWMNFPFLTTMTKRFLFSTQMEIASLAGYHSSTTMSLNVAF